MPDQRIVFDAGAYVQADNNLHIEWKYADPTVLRGTKSNLKFPIFVKKILEKERGFLPYKYFPIDLLPDLDATGRMLFAYRPIYLEVLGVRLTESSDVDIYDFDVSTPFSRRDIMCLTAKSQGIYQDFVAANDYKNAISKWYKHLRGSVPKSYPGWSKLHNILSKVRDDLYNKPSPVFPNGVAVLNDDQIGYANIGNLLDGEIQYGRVHQAIEEAVAVPREFLGFPLENEREAAVPAPAPVDNGNWRIDRQEVAVPAIRPDAAARALELLNEQGFWINAAAQGLNAIDEAIRRANLELDNELALAYNEREEALNRMAAVAQEVRQGRHYELVDDYEPVFDNDDNADGPF